MSAAEDDMMRKAKNFTLNVGVQQVDAIVSAFPDPVIQMGVLMLAQAIVFRRITKKVGANDRFSKKRLLKRAAQDFESKIQQYGFADPPSPPKL